MIEDLRVERAVDWSDVEGRMGKGLGEHVGWVRMGSVRDGGLSGGNWGWVHQVGWGTGGVCQGVVN